MQTTARLPTVPASRGALTRKPLPMIEASGVTVAFQLDEPASRFEKARYAPNETATVMMIAFSTSSALQRLLHPLASSPAPTSHDVTSMPPRSDRPNISVKNPKSKFPNSNSRTCGSPTVS